jgi:uncharacterized Fe-S cluster-containing radical SAM superfamily protein
MKQETLTQTLAKMRKLAVPEPGIYAVAPLHNTKMSGNLTNILRVFTAIHPQRGRKPNIDDFHFDKYTDVLSDSPLTAAAKVGSHWEAYKHHVIVQLGVCNFRCWYCYVDYKLLSGRSTLLVTAEMIMEQFFDQRQKAKANGQEYNVLRISGGEPFFAPDLMLSCLKIVKEKGLDSEVCIKTETNLSPLLKIGTHSFAEEWASLEELSRYKNFYVHPTLHGINPDSLHTNSAVNPDLFDKLLEGLQTLLTYKIDFYPSFSSNTISSDNIPGFFQNLKSINYNLPLRTAVRPFRFDYEVIRERKQGKRALPVFEHQQAITLWDSLLRSEYGVGYAEKPRHIVPLYEG